MTRNKKITPAPPAEYVLLITPVTDELTGEPATLVALRTTTEFTNFRYEINVESRLEGKTLTLVIRGLHAPDLKLPGVGPANFNVRLPGLRGTYTVTVSKHGKVSNSFSVRVSRTSVKIERKDDGGFVDFVTRAEEW